MPKISVKRVVYFVIDALIVALLVCFDQFTKRMAIAHLMNKEPFVIWKGIFEFQYLENRGAAFGILQNSKYIFIASSVVVLITVLYFYFKLPSNKKYLPIKLVLLLLFAGACGNNLIDRIQYSYVIDFMYFKLINFPIFNVADCYVVVGAILLGILILFFYKEEDLKILAQRRQKGNNNE